MFDQVAEVISDTLHISKDRITKDMLLVEDLGVDSLEMYRLWLALEDAFDAEIRPDSDDWKAKTVGDLCDRLKKNLSDIV